MQKRLISFIAVLALVLAACSTGEDAAPTTEPPEATTTTSVDVPEAVQLSYSLEAGTSMTYEVEMDQSIQMEVEGDAAALAEAGEEDFPETLDIQMSGTTLFTQSVADGPEDGTYEITIVGDFSDLEITGTIDGEPVSGEDAPLPDDFTGMDSVEKTIIVDEQGNVIPQTEDFGGDLFGSLGGFGGLDMLEEFGAVNPGQFVGPPFSDEEVTVGDTWEESIEVPTMPGDDAITTSVESEVIATEDRNGVEVFVIETVQSTSEIQFDFAEILIGFMSAFIPDDASEEEIAEMEALTEGLRFAFTVDPTVAEMTTWFDPVSGVSVESRAINDSHVVMDIAVPDEETGEIVEMLMDMSISSDITYRLVEDTGGDA
jgi:hypothetical protein